MADKLILTVHVELDRERIIKLESPAGKVTMLPFSGTVEGEIFCGVVAPCGVDTQVTDRCGVRHMSARYMLAGRDREGQPCHIYVDNEGWFVGSGQLPRPFQTTPTFLTDSVCLAPYLHANRFRGEGHGRTDGSPDILFFEVDE